MTATIIAAYREIGNIKKVAKHLHTSQHKVSAVLHEAGVAKRYKDDNQLARGIESEYGGGQVSGGRASKIKGDNFEREVCAFFGGQRTYWQPGQENKPDAIDVPYLGRGECKRRKAQFRRLYGWIEGNDFLALRDDRQPMLVVVRAQDLKLILDEMDEIKRGVATP